ncbi:MAG TPA: CheR family methyltransferase [Candidatus Methanoperedens sp.]|nr:CheR family methyltransferase [Candidatus Methanoperedens sp.]
MTSGLSESRLAQLSEFVAATTALHFPRDRWDEIGRKVCSAAKEFGFDDDEAFIHWLLSSTLTTEQVEILASRLTINETYFWREPRSFEALEEHILPELIRLRDKGDRRLRIWSAGCSTGEEPYSIAIAVCRLLPAREDWRVSILATDINPGMLRRATTGVYGKSSFRNPPPWLKKDYFRPHGDGRWEIHPEIREMVTFAYLNLAEDVYPSPLSNTMAMDIVFCRNVLMYFSPERVTNLGQRFFGALVDGGWLIVGACELSQQLFPQFSPVNFPGAIVYRKESPIGKARTRFASAAVVEPAAPPPPFRDSEAMPAVEGVPRGKAANAETPRVHPLSIRELADQGKLTEALAACDGAIAADRIDPGLHYLRAVILQEQNNDGGAIVSLRRALYLAPNFVPAHFALGNLMLRRGNSRAAGKCFRNVLEILSPHRPGDVLPEFGGLTAGRFREIVHATLQAGASA